MCKYDRLKKIKIIMFRRILRKRKKWKVCKKIEKVRKIMHEFKFSQEEKQYGKLIRMQKKEYRKRKKNNKI